MIHNEDEGCITIRGNNSPWAVQYSQDSAVGPESLDHADRPFLTSCACLLDDLEEAMALPSDVRAMRKGKAAVVSIKSELPFGAKVSFHTTHRYCEHSMRAVRDIHIPAGAVLKQALEVDSLKLGNGFTAIRLAETDGKLTEWQEIPETLSWPQHPLMILLRRDDGMVLEIGVGSDLWRWNNGVAPEANQGLYELVKSDDGILFRRCVTLVKGEEISPLPRFYRFSWYMAWGQEADAAVADERTPVPASWRPNGDLALGALADHVGATKNPIIEIDVSTLPWPKEALRSSDSQPCVCGRNTVKRLKRVIRQLLNFEPDDMPVRFLGLAPGFCEVGRHVDRKRQAPHWDMASLIDFGAWTRQCLGNDRELLVDAGSFDAPGLRTIFVPSNHDEDAIHYEWDPDKEDDEDDYEE